MLHRQVQVVDQLGHAGIHVYQRRRELVRMAGGVTNALDARNLGHVFDQRRQIGRLAAASHRGPIGIDILPQQRDLAHALVGQAGDLDQHVVERT